MHFDVFISLNQKQEKQVTISQPPQVIDMTRSMSAAFRSESLHFNPKT
ncbi:unnamed protein product [Brassica oleracea var. botrytis]